jgi:hypothetical protein
LLAKLKGNGMGSEENGLGLPQKKEDYKEI